MLSAAVRRLACMLACGVSIGLAGASLAVRSSEPRLFLWAWERNTNLDGLDTARAGVAYLAGSIQLRGDSLAKRPRLQPLVVPRSTRLLAVVRIDVSRADPPRYGKGQQAAASSAVLDLARPGQASGAVEGVQVDFDAPVSGRAFYAALLRDVRAGLPRGARLSVTALASWCLGDPWIAGLPVDEAVPMLFRMGADQAHVEAVLARRGDFTLPVCRQGVGLSSDEPRDVPLRGRRAYLFNPLGWTSESAAAAVEDYSR